jgi:hypothetical protein
LLKFISNAANEREWGRDAEYWQKNGGQKNGDGIQIPNPKFQAPNKSQDSNSNVEFLQNH